MPLMAVASWHLCWLLAGVGHAVTTYYLDTNGSAAGLGIATGQTYDWDAVTNGGFLVNLTARRCLSHRLLEPRELPQVVHTTTNSLRLTPSR